MTKALFVIDVQNDFTEGGALGVTGGAAVAAKISDYILAHAEEYDYVVFSRDWHAEDSDNGGHISDNPDYIDTWPEHCIQFTRGADFHWTLDQLPYQADAIFNKGMDKPAYSIWDGEIEVKRASGIFYYFPTWVEKINITDVDIVGIATDYCVLQSALDTVKHGIHTRVLLPLTAAVHNPITEACLTMSDAGIELVYNV